MKLNKFFALSFFFCIFACIASAQQPQGKGGGQPAQGPTATGIGTANSNVTVVQQGGNTDNRQFINALPGTSGNPGPFPGVPMNNGDWQLYCPLCTFAITDTDVARKKHGTKNIHAFVVGTVEANSNPIHSINWWPEEAGFEPNDHVLGEFTAITKSLEPKLEVVEAMLSLAKEQTHSSRCAIRYRTVGVGVTSGFSLGGSAAAAALPGSTATAAAVGGMIGKNKVHREELIEFDSLCLNDGPFEAPQRQAAASAPASAVAPAPASPQEVHVVVDVRSVPAIVTPTPPSTGTSNTCRADFAAELPEEDREFHFSWNNADIMESFPESPKTPFKIIESHNDEHSIKMADFINRHTNCRFQFEGFTCKIGNDRDSGGLAYMRALNMRNAIMKRLTDAGKRAIVQHSSLGNQFSGKEYDWHDRKARLKLYAD